MSASPLRSGRVSHLLVVAEEDDANFQIMRLGGFDENAVRRFGSLPCTVRLQLRRSSVPELSTFDRLTDMPGLRELCSLAHTIRAGYAPRRRHRPPAYTMPPFCVTENQDKRLAWLRSDIALDQNGGTLLIRNKIYGFRKPQSSRLRDSILFPGIKKIAQSWNFDIKGTVFESSQTE